MNASLASAGPAPASPSREIAPEGAVVRLPERCTEQVRYTQRTSASGERAFGHFIVEARVLADAVWQQIAAPLLEDTQPADIALHRWLRHPERDDGEPTSLPPAGREFQSTIEQLFTEGRARAFCACCNRNIARHQVVRELPDPITAHGATRYFCAEGHLLLRVETGRWLAGAESTAA